MTQEQMLTRLQTAFPDSDISVHDLTGTQDHWEVYVTSSAFAGLSRIQQQQKVMAVFAAELKTGEVHALTMKTKEKQK
jgi:stress-induced morphogen